MRFKKLVYNMISSERSRGSNNNCFLNKMAVIQMGTKFVSIVIRDHMARLCVSPGPISSFSFSRVRWPESAVEHDNGEIERLDIIDADGQWM